MQSKEKLVIIGNGMVGCRFVEKMIDAGGLEKYEVTVLSGETIAAYDRVHLSELFSGKSARDLELKSPAWYAEQGVELLLGAFVTELDLAQKSLRTASGESLHYDKLVLATGSKPFVPPVSGLSGEGVFVYRDVKDVEQIKAFGQKVKTAAVIGGGLLGLEAAKALVDMGLKTKVVEVSPRLMPRQLDERGAKMLSGMIESLGVELFMGKMTQQVSPKNQGYSFEFTDGQNLDVDMIVVSAGIVPNDKIAKDAGLETAPRGGVVVDSRMQTSNPAVFAIGEVASFGGMTYGLVGPGYLMANAAVSALMGGNEAFQAADMSTKLKLMGVEVGSFGDALAENPGAKEVIVEDKHKGVFQKLVICESSNKLLGGILVGDTSLYGPLHQQFQLGIPLPESPASLFFPESPGSTTLKPSDLPDEAILCNCEGITKGKIKQAIFEGAVTLGEIKGKTKAGTGCGGCVPMLTEVLNYELKAQGIEIDKSLCEHFAMDRVTLFEKIKQQKIQSFDEAILQLGKGKGCEICKPTVASALSSAFNQPIYKQQKIQDTNDAFLANIQHNGTYSVIPRMPGGEVTPEQLIAVGEVAKDYNLYMKITGAQRIALFGAQRDDLPAIWERMIAVGLESGQAYGKALRMVKSCVGNVWCHLAVGNSLDLAVALENRYKGLRSPHKMKGAVSGCVRECAEVNSKDFGAIATDKGFNLYVCGNGGAQPQHAQLLASDITAEEVIKYTDRFLIYYFQTADRLHRTATWLNNLEGGIQRLRQVIVADSLGIGEQLEAEMAELIKNQHCEWKEALKDGKHRKLFKSFINSDESDSSIRFETERGQIRPAC